MLSICGKVNAEARALRPASTWRVADDRAHGAVNKRVEDLRALGHGSLKILVGQYYCEVQRVGADAHPCQGVGTSSCPILEITRRGDLVGKSRCDGS